MTETPAPEKPTLDAVDVCACAGFVSLTAGMWLAFSLGAALIADGALLLGVAAFVTVGGRGGSAS